ncbi:MAG: hypothetical protein ACXAEF_14675 [Candidatus Thorarchaeota archaeon]
MVLIPFFAYLGFGGLISIILYFSALRRGALRITSPRSILLLLAWFLIILAFSYLTYLSNIDFLRIDPWDGVVSPSDEIIFFSNQLAVIVATGVFCVLVAGALTITWELNKNQSLA